MNPIQLMKINETNMTKSEIKIMEYVIENLENIANASILNISDKIPTSKSALMRFCQKIGYSGFSEFKYDVSHYLSIRAQNHMSKGKETIAAIYSDTIKDLDVYLHEEILNQFKQLIETSNKVKIFGVAETGLTAQFFSFRMIDNGFDIEAVTNIQFFKSKVVAASKQDLNIFLSLSGNTEAIKNAMELSVELGIPTVLITQNDRHMLKDQIECFVLLPFFKSQDTNLILDSQVVLHGFAGVVLNYLLGNN